MFEFFRSRDKSVRYLLTALLAMVALSMVTYLIPGGPGAGGGNNPGEQQVAEVCGETITIREVMAGIQNATRNKQFPPEMIQNYIPVPLRCRPVVYFREGSPCPPSACFMAS